MNDSKLFVMPKKEPEAAEEPKPAPKQTVVELLQDVIEKLTTGELKDDKYTEVVVIIDGDEAEYRYKIANNLSRGRIHWLLHSSLLHNIGARFAKTDD